MPASTHPPERSAGSERSWAAAPSAAARLRERVENGGVGVDAGLRAFGGLVVRGRPAQRSTGWLNGGCGEERPRCCRRRATGARSASRKIRSIVSRRSARRRVAAPPDSPLPHAAECRAPRLGHVRQFEGQRPADDALDVDDLRLADARPLGQDLRGRSRPSPRGSPGRRAMVTCTSAGCGRCPTGSAPMSRTADGRMGSHGPSIRLLLRGTTR